MANDRSIKVLLVEDDEDDYILIRDLLGEVPEQQFQLDWVATFETALTAIHQHNHDIYLVDYRLGERDGLELLKLINQQNDSPVIILSGQGDRALDITALSSGAADYLDKSYLHSSVLEHYIRASIERNQAIKALRESEKKYRELFKRENQLRRELSRSNAELQDFAHIASHDLQEPLRAISGYTKLLKTEYSSEFDSTAHEYMDFVIDGTHRMRGLIEDLLTYSRVGTSELILGTVDCNKVVEEAITNLQTSIEEARADIIYRDLPCLTADRTQLVQLFQNLLVNAIKFRRQNISPQISIHAESTEDKSWLFKVVDNGIGIKTEYYDRIFKIFKRLHTHREFSGTGVGLALCRKIVERHGGKIWVESELGNSSTFFFTIPNNSTNQNNPTNQSRSSFFFPSIDFLER
ncbi:ATP-binding protein [Myxosarcina sp. GI1]|uniref:sensor histidine kinase n=1 Tax=Myxosarcina sp. GI1 TaxID=1541065 RepID=UPI000689A8FA|nr:hybrid sensor histidine kinase/response regulator [Myxosarcina sp. GI1]